ncbi:g3926 [Coccomyxa elongata]
MRVLKASVHIPGWESYNINPFRWRGACFGRTVSECFCVGIHPTRWARSAYGGNLGARFRRGTSSQRTWKEVIGSLSALYCWASLALSFGLGHLICAGGAWGLNFMSWFSCVTRRQLRRRFRLPATFGLPDGCDDCAVHTCCMYCASHQELRELAVRGVGGPSIHVLDVTSRSFSHVPGIEARLQQRAAELAIMEEAPVAFPPAPATPIPEEAPPPEVEMQRVP